MTMVCLYAKRSQRKKEALFVAGPPSLSRCNTINSGMFKWIMYECATRGNFHSLVCVYCILPFSHDCTTPLEPAPKTFFVEITAFDRAGASKGATDVSGISS